MGLDYISGIDVLNITWTFRWLSVVAWIECFWAICADPIPLLSLEFGWLYGVNDRLSSGKDGSWSDV